LTQDRGVAKSWPRAGSATDERPPTPVAIALGSNLGDRAAHLAFALDRLRPFLEHLRVSPFFETEPVGGGVQPWFLNGAAIGRATLGPRHLLDVLLAIERDRGRERPFPNAPRTLDLDLILYGQAIVSEPGLTVPHPRFRERAFVLGPLVEIAADMRDPVTGKTVGELWAGLRAD
jgi:2-amino-4-hydroxy-6-hydroxymethyldihydropteridine diphosphokinase